ncbi:cupin domain-containing protein [Comamonas sp. wu1-DMT]|uniref:JmjC domain-containing protein n=1 Tax=Comamonas sp. wu1-DMT TaxID=3126390 RepID=UPI0032E41DE0
MINFPISIKKFEQDYLGKKYAFFEKAHNLKMDWSEIDQTLYSWDVSDKHFKLVKGSENLTSKVLETYQDIGRVRTRIIKEILYEELSNGATLLLDRLDIKNEKINNITFDIGRFYGEKAICNGYISFRDDPAFKKHWDTHDVFAVQIKGRKLWKIYSPTFEYPLVHQKSISHIPECPDSPVFEVVLNEGDVIYIPRGWWHEVSPINGEPTFHIAVGIHYPKIKDYINWVCNTLLDDNVIFRKSIKSNQKNIENLDEINNELVKLISNQDNLDQFNLIHQSALRVNTSFNLEKLVLSKGNELNIHDSEQIALNSYQDIPDSGASKIIANGISLNVDEKSMSSLSEIVKTGKFNNEKERKLAANLIKCDVLQLRKDY